MYNFYVLTYETIKLYVDEILFYLNYIITCKYNSLSLLHKQYFKTTQETTFIEFEINYEMIICKRCAFYIFDQMQGRYHMK